MSGSIPHRKGIADVASFLLSQDKHRDKCVPLLLQLFDDPEKEVRQKASHCIFNKPELLEWPESKSFLPKFIQSRAFRDDPTGILLTFEKYQGSLLPFAEVIFRICEGLVAAAASQQDFPPGLWHDASMIPPLLLRLYDQSEQDHPKTMKKCLDAWDILFQNGIGPTRDIARAIER